MYLYLAHTMRVALGYVSEQALKWSKSAVKHLEGLEDPRRELDSQQRVSSSQEEVVRCRHVRQAQQLTPEVSQRLQGTPQGV